MAFFFLARVRYWRIAYSNIISNPIINYSHCFLLLWFAILSIVSLQSHCLKWSNQEFSMKCFDLYFFSHLHSSQYGNNSNQITRLIWFCADVMLLEHWDIFEQDFWTFVIYEWLCIISCASCGLIISKKGWENNVGKVLNFIGKISSCDG